MTGNEAGLGGPKGVCWSVSCRGDDNLVDVSEGNGGGFKERRRGTKDILTVTHRRAHRCKRKNDSQLTQTAYLSGENEGELAMGERTDRRDTLELA